jgi:hypothetical protein
MKKRVENVILMSLVVVAFVGLLYFCATTGTNYNRQVTVVEVNGNYTTFVDDSGEAWDYYTTDYNVGDEVVLVMDSYNTPNDITDDIILEIK